MRGLPISLPPNFLRSEGPPRVCHGTPRSANHRPRRMFCRETIREQNALSEEIVNAITSNPIGDPIDEDELEAELENMQQEALDNEMLNAGTVPVADAVHRLPAAANGERKCAHDTSLCRRDPNAVRKFLVPGNRANTSSPGTVKGKQTAVEEDDEEAELRKLQAEMAM